MITRVSSKVGFSYIVQILEHHIGDSKLSNKQNELPEPTAGVSLRPDDPFAKRLTSAGVPTRNVLIKVTVPKRTGRKRKRGSDEPFSSPEQPETQQLTSVTGPQLLDRLRDNEGKYQIEPVGILRETHRFRALPDFQMRSGGLPVMQKLRDHVLTPSYDRLSKFSIDLSSSTYDGDLGYPAPPRFTSFDMPHKYEYQQAPGVVFVQDEDGQIQSKNIAAPVKRLTWGLAPDIEEVPQGPPHELPRKNPGGEMLPKAVQELAMILEDRPLITKRVALNSMNVISESIFKEATQYVGYSFKAGPWKDALIKYGVDPRKDPKYRHYQTLMFQMDAHAFNSHSQDKPAWKQNETNTTWARPLRHQKDAPSTHIFDGKSITANGKTWQICDVHDPVVRNLLQTEELPTECDVYQWGWYYNGTMAKVRTIMKDKMKYLFAKEEPPHADYEVLAKLPDHLSRANIKQAIISSKEYNIHLMLLATEVRNIIKSGDNLNVRSSKNLWERRSKGISVDKDDSDDDNDLNEDLQNIDDGNNVEGDFAQDFTAFELDPALQREADGGAVDEHEDAQGDAQQHAEDEGDVIMADESRAEVEDRDEESSGMPLASDQVETVANNEDNQE